MHFSLVTIHNGHATVHEVASTRRGPEWVDPTHDLHTQEHSEAQQVGLLEYDHGIFAGSILTRDVHVFPGVFIDLPAEWIRIVLNGELDGANKAETFSTMI